ncbi:hypothetical protein NQ318_010256 [Aromia moschata]|uniref:Uncharacterized protein n=1 Tax=Aromia moschata TaxID=1265417 RepID=A0AAV8YIZ9_9CUCU|nr:hypothetical protein NQ318_010256 [Aromia moschata]
MEESEQKHEASLSSASSLRKRIIKTLPPTENFPSLHGHTDGLLNFLNFKPNPKSPSAIVNLQLTAEVGKPHPVNIVQ